MSFYLIQKEMLVFNFSITYVCVLIFVKTMFEHLLFIYLNCFLRTIFVRIIIFILSYYTVSCHIRILIFLNLPCPHIPSCHILVAISVSVLLSFAGPSQSEMLLLESMLSNTPHNADILEAACVRYMQVPMLW